MIALDSMMNRRFMAGAALLLGAVCTYWTWIRPYEISYTEAVRKAADFSERSDRVQLELKQLQVNKRALDSSLDAFHSLDKSSPRQPAIVWLPAHIKSAFSRLGMKEPDVKLDQSTSDAELPDYARTGWDIMIPPQDEEHKLTDVLLAVARIEQGRPFIRIENLSLDLAYKDSGNSIGYLKLITYLPK